MIHEDMKKIVYGGDYNPEQWPEEIWHEDMRIVKLADIDIMSVNIFAWAMVQPDENTYDFTQLDQVMDLLYENNIYASLATSTAAHPAWMAKRYPDILRVDFDGRKRKFGLRHNSCPNSPTYRKYAAMLVEKIAQRYEHHPALAVWHVSNEYGGDCYCDNCERAFRVWLKAKYKTLDVLNKAWNTRFWGHLFYDWDEIVLPNNLSEHLGTDTFTAFQGISLDYRRFNSDSMLDCFKLEYDIIKKYTPDVKITTNLMGPYKPLDYQKWAKYMDIVSWDNYPDLGAPMSKVAMNHDLMRGLKQGEPFMLMEQTPSVTNWLPYNSLKRPGVMRLWSYQSIAHGADAVMFFQIRRSIGACEKYHGAVIDHVGHEHTRVFREVATLGKELTLLKDKVVDARTNAKVAIIFDWDNWWAVELSSGPSRDLKYYDEVWKYYQAFYEQNISVDIISVEDPIDGYSVVVAPVLYMTKTGHAKRIEEFVEGGGTFVTTFFSGIVNEHDLVITGGYPGELRKLLGIWVEEIDALPPGKTNEIIMDSNVNGFKKTYTCSLLCDILHLEGADAIATYGQDFYQGTPVITKNKYGNGTAWYVATSMDDAFMNDFVEQLSKENNIKSILGQKAPVGVEVTVREKDQQSIIFILNHNEHQETLSLKGAYTNLLTKEHVSQQLIIEARDVIVLTN
ncbi:beta-galactosidase [Bacillus sp. FSL K6-3431]|uniref:beta-galactosidase n=1 Tax=Bacillus sp. FSL K6-3431 TaxID=2921500 RepID=UPI0030FB901A